MNVFRESVFSRSWLAGAFMVIGALFSACGGDSERAGEPTAGEGGSDASGRSGAGGRAGAGASGAGGDAGSSGATAGRAGGGQAGGAGMDTGGSPGRGGSAATAGEGGRDDAGTAGDDGGRDGSGGTGASGAGGQGTSGTGGGSPTACSSPYEGPAGGPREGGPPLLMQGCSAISDEVILERYALLEAQGSAVRMPETLYDESTGQLVLLEEPCSDSPETALANALARDRGVAEGAYTTDWFYEVALCEDDRRTVYRNLRCDYFDGTTLANPTGEELAFLASLLYWHENNNLQGSMLLGYSINIAGSGDFVETCSIQVTYGDFGLCDQIRVFATDHALQVGSGVSLGEPQVLRTIDGTCR